MSVIIHNVGYISDPKKSDECMYEIRINHRTITACTHRRSEGLATLLRRAADAVDAEAIVCPKTPLEEKT